MSGQANKDEKIGAKEPILGAAGAGTGGYKVGRGRPPKEYSWKKGQSGNPSGRPRKKPNKKEMIERVLKERLVIREDGKARKITKEEAVLRAQLAKAIGKADTRAAKYVREEAASAGFGEEQLGGVSTIAPPKDKTAQSEALFANLNLDLLSYEDKIELARLGSIIDLGGDFTALSLRDFERAQRIVNKGRGKDVTLNG